MTDYNQLFERGEDYCAAAVLNWDKRRSKIIKQYVETKSFLFPYEHRCRHMKLALLLEAWIGEVLLYYRIYKSEQERGRQKLSVVDIEVSKTTLAKTKFLRIVE